MPESERRLLMQELKENPFLELQKEFSSYYKVDRCVRTDPVFKFIEPVEHKVLIPPSDCTEEPKEIKFAYISVPETLSLVAAALGTRREEQHQDDLIRDVKDGLAYKSNQFFNEFPEAYTLIFYSDGVALNNPLGACKGKNKLVNIYWTIAEIPKHLRSKTENWFLALSIKENDLKLGREQVYKPLVDDLLRLEEGIQLDDGSILRAGVLCYIADNLEAHLVGGFSACFSSKDICRVCHMQSSDLQDITGIPSAAAWTREEYDSILEANETQENFGLKYRCELNKLKSFDAVGQLPFDPMHDVHEKVVSTDVHAIILALSQTGLITVERYNDLLRNLPLHDYESSDRPLPVNPKDKMLSGKALSNASHVRLLPFILSRLIPESVNSDLIDLALMLSKLNEYILADAFSLADVTNFKELVIDFLDKRKVCREQFPVFKKITPKMHYLEHYSEQILQFGPFVCTWTARCESRHRDFVNYAESAKNFINIVKTVTTKNQKKMASRNYNGFFSAPEIQFPAKISTLEEGGRSLPGMVCIVILYEKLPLLMTFCFTTYSRRVVDPVWIWIYTGICFFNLDLGCVN